MSSKARLLKFSVLAGIFFLFGFLWSFFTPRIEQFILTSIEKRSSQLGPLRILPESLKLSLAPLSIEIKNLKVLPKPEVAAIIKPFLVKKVDIDIDLLSLLRGLIRIDEVKIDGSFVRINVPKKDPKSPLPVIELDKIFAMVPVNSIVLENISLEVTDPHFEFKISTSKLNAKISNDYPFLILDVKPTTVGLESTVNEFEKQKFKVEAMVALSQQKLILTSTKLITPDSYVLASGSANIDLKNLKFLGYHGQVRSYFNLEKIYKNPSLQKIVKNKIPEMSGLLRVHGLLSGQKWEESEVKIQTTAKELFVKGFELGSIDADLVWKKNSLVTEKFSLLHSAGAAKLKSFVLETKNDWPIRFQADVQKVELAKLLHGLKIKNAPLHVDIHGELSCSGTLKNVLAAKCETEKIVGEDVRVWAATPNKEIINIPVASVKGSATVDSRSVSFDTTLKVGENTTGASQGVIDYENGFEIMYQSPQIDFKDVKNLAHLNLEGLTSLKGEVRGNSGSATFQMDTVNKNISVDRFFIGNLTTKLNYAKGVLNLIDIQGQQSNTRFQGQLEVDLTKSSLKGNIDLPYLELVDVKNILDKRFTIPFSMTGTGNAKLTFNGPFDFFKMSYHLDAVAYRGKIQDESFDEILVKLQSNNGLIKTENFVLKKGEGQMNLQAQVTPEGTIDGEANGSRFLLEDTSLTSKHKLRLSGISDFDILLSGTWKDPLVLINGRIYQTRFSDRPLPDTTYEVRILRDLIRFDTSLFGAALKLSGELPYDDKLPVGLVASARDWDFTQLFASLDPNLANRNFKSNVSLDFSTTADRKQIWNSVFDLRVKKFNFQRGNLGLEAPKEFAIKYDHGLAKVTDLNLVGEGSYFRVTNSAVPRSPIDLQINGKFNLALLTLFTPFLEDLSAITSVSVNFQAGPKTFDILGSAYFERGFIKIFDFPHPIEDVRADLLFNQHRILVNSVKGQLAGGKFFGDGQIELEAAKKIPLRLDIHLDNGNFNIPQGYQTSGSADISLRGDWFPYTMSGKYRIFKSMINAEFGGGGSTQEKKTLVRRKYLLPGILGESQVSPLLLNLEVESANPIRIENSLMDGKAFLNMNIQGPPNQPILRGTVTLEQYSKLIFRDRRFDVQTATVKFDGKETLDPILFINATTRVMSYDITLLVQGRSSKPEINLSSQPSLGQQDLISLLALGVTSTQNVSAVDSLENQRQSTYQLGAAVLSNNPLGKEIKNRFGWEMQIAPTFDEENNVAVPKVTFSKQVAPRLGATASYERGKQPKTDVKLRYLVNKQIYLVGSFVSSPLEEANQLTQSQQQNANIFGIDLEYKREFK